MVACFAADCEHTSESHTCKHYFRFPKEEHPTYKTWFEMSRRDDLGPDEKPTTTNCLCSCHFKDNLRKNGPSIFTRNAKKVFQFQSPEKRTRRSLSFTSPTPSTASSQASPADSSDQIDATPGPPPSPIDIRELQVTNILLQAEVSRLQGDIGKLTLQLERATTRLTYEQIKSSEQRLRHYTGLPSSSHFDVLHSVCQRFEISYKKAWNVRCMATEDQLLLTLMKLRLNLSDLDLAQRFGVGEGTVANVFHTWLYILHDIVSLGFQTIPSTRKNKACMPGSFAEFSNCRIVLDCTEIQVCNSRENMEVQRQTYSNYKSRNTFKALVGVAPNGVITYVSDMYPGSKSDKEIVKDSRVLEQMSPGDVVLADKGFLIQELLPQGVSLNLPPFLNNGVFTRQESVFTIKIARARIHVERAIGRIKQFSILDYIPSHMRCYASMLFRVCSGLVNLQNPLINEVAAQYDTGNADDN